MSRKKYDLFEKEVKKNDKQTTIHYVKCSCHHLAIRQNEPKGVFRCSRCCMEYTCNKYGKVIKYEPKY